MKEQGLLPSVFKSERGGSSITITRKASMAEIAMDDENCAVLEFCREPETREEISQMLGIKTAAYAMSKYISPLLLSGKIRMTNPDKRDASIRNTNHHDLYA